MTDGVVVVGYGNALPTDDRLGWHAADRLANEPYSSEPDAFLVSCEGGVAR